MSGARRRHWQPPVADLGLIVIDGDNLLHRVRGMRDEAGLHWLLPRLRAWRPTDVEILLMLDGSPGPGVGRRQQASPGIRMQHSGGVDADTAIVDLVHARTYGDRSRTVVVTDDRGLSERVRYAGVLVRRIDWLIHQLAAPGLGLTTLMSNGAAPRPPGGTRPVTGARPPTGIGRGKPPHSPDATTPIERDADVRREPWRPGRGATTKRGNAHKAPKGPLA